MKKWPNWIFALMATVPLAVQAQVDLTRLDRDMAGPRSQVLVLGTYHLKNMPPSFNPASLDGLLNRLAAFKPDIITIELQPSEECDLFVRHAERLGKAFNCISTDAAKEATGLDLPAAVIEVEKTLKAWPAQPTAAQRRGLAATFMAASDIASAYVQWLQLPASERRAGDHLSAALVETLTKLENRNDEYYQLAARLAVRLGLQRLRAIDNHTGDDLDLDDVKAYAKALTDAWNAGNAELKTIEKQFDALKQAADMLPLYRLINSIEYQTAVADAEVRAAMRGKSAQNYAQIWVAGWEIRNLRMIANIRETFRERPGARVLTIVGSAHKPWFDSWLGQLQGVDIVDATAVLK